MQTEIEPILKNYKGWKLRELKPVEESEHVMLMIHGWMGDENSMWVLAHNLPADFTVLAPRGPIQVPDGGFSWRQIKPGTWGKATMDELVPMVNRLTKFVDEWAEENRISIPQFDVMGFSQGAAMAYAMFLTYPERIRRVAALAGFIPIGGKNWLSKGKMVGKSIFISHGRADDKIPVAQARFAVNSLKEAGAEVVYCETNTGHKVSRECMGEMKKYFANF